VEPFLLGLALAAGIVVSVYPKYAPRQGWRVMPAFKQSGGNIMTIGIASMMGAAILALATLDIVTAAIVIVAAPMMALLFMHLLKSGVQNIAFALIVVSWLWYLLVRVV
jgi:hypothetical protein